MNFKALIGGVALSALFAHTAEAGLIYSAPASTGPIATNQTDSLSFSSSPVAAGLSFVIDGYGSLDGQNFYEDDFSLKLNNVLIFSGTFNLGGGSNSGSQFNIYSNPFGATFTNLTGNGTGIGWHGGQEALSFAGLPLIAGLNTITFGYTSLGTGHAGFQGLRDEGWGIEQVAVSAVPGPTVGAGAASFAFAACLLGWLMNRRSRRFA
ncbi:hypothetical protein JJE66_29395 [Bradyrhizobium diazoefficiens]|uniref:hypothetical protein n=1 Tax=Bradyrhizobium diazoefficiens TaxID=1355477 RepID=UPI00190DED2B|nr:hypothetical protein [Bradyrhizobium diazoefficiens]MBK3665334.1 hypothetical protein [Bradyrhizobium diazoefficiens]